jgi:hypothetical protein
MTNKRAYGDAVAKLQGGTASEQVIRRRELAALAELGLGHALEAPKLAELARIQAELRRTQQRLKGRFDDGHLTAPDYLKLLNAALARSMDRSIGLLGVAAFDAIFGDTGKDPEGLIDAEMFFKKTDTARPQ